MLGIEAWNIHLNHGCEGQLTAVSYMCFSPSGQAAEPSEAAVLQFSSICSELFKLYGKILRMFLNVVVIVPPQIRHAPLYSAVDFIASNQQIYIRKI